MKDLETVKKEYKLSEEEHEKIQKQIISVMLYDKHPVEHPKAIIDIAPPASGKTGLNGYGKEQFVDNNVVIINSDELKPFHPKVDEIARLYPEYYTKVTDQESNTWTSELFNTALKMGYNVIFEGTGRNARILETIKSKMQNYEVTVRGMAVNELNCLISILERYEHQVEKKGWGRLVTSEHFYETYNAMPETIEAIEQSGVVYAVEIYKRGNSPTQPTMIYNSKTKNGKYPNAKNAVIMGRKEDRKAAIACFEERFKQLEEMIKNKGMIEEEKVFVEKILELYRSIVQQEAEVENEEDR